MERRKDAEAARTLIYFSIVHTETDLGSLGESAKRMALGKLGAVGWRRKAQAIEQRWTEIENAIEALRLDYARVRLYQDGMPVCGRELEIARDLAAGGSRNHQLLVRLIDRGATLMGTESSELLVKEYELARQTLHRGLRGGATRGQRSTQGDAILEARNRYIADRINATLKPGETGLLFLGMLHSLKGLLDPDIRIVSPL